MVTIQVKNIKGETSLPIAGSKVAAGYDIVASSDPIIVGDKRENGTYNSVDYIQFNTKLQISPKQIITNKLDLMNPWKHNYHTLLFPRSSIRKYNLLLANSIGLVDADYRGEIIFCYKYIFQPCDFVIEGNVIAGNVNPEKVYKKGDRIGQLVASMTHPMEFELVDELDATERGAGGFGSTGITAIQPEIPKYGITPGKSLAEIFITQETIPVKKRYSDEIKERNSQ